MAYNPYSAVNAIYKLKGQWNDADAAGNTKAKNDIAAKAQGYYNMLKDNGYTDIAEELTNSSYAQSKAINDKWAKMGKTATRDYLYSLGESKDMSKSDVDKLISWDNTTGQLTFGGKNVGTPDAVVDGVSYWGDTKVLDNAFNDYIGRSGTTRSTETAINQENENLFAKYNKEYEDLKNTNPFETETGKAILAKYDLAGLQGRNNEVASGAGSNGGNIDSFAAANALRQQSALVNQGHMTALEAHQQKLDHARALLSDMGVNIDRVFNQDQTAKNNDVARKSEIASVTGIAPDEWVVSNNPYLNDDGTIKEKYKDVDFAAVMANAKATGNTEAYNAAATARYYKIMTNYGAYGQFDDGNYILPGSKKTEAARQFDEQIAASDRALNTEKEINTANNQNKIEQIKTNAALIPAEPAKPTLTANQAIEAIKRGEVTQGVIDAYNYHHKSNYTVDNPPKVGTGGIDLLTGGGTGEGDGTVNVVTIDAIDEEKMKSCGVDKHGKSMLEALQKEAAAQGGFLTEDELLEFVKTNSDAHNTNLDQLKKVYSYLGADKAKLEALSDAGFWFWEWGKGVK